MLRQLHQIVEIHYPVEREITTIPRRPLRRRQRRIEILRQLHQVIKIHAAVQRRIAIQRELHNHSRPIDTLPGEHPAHRDF